MKWFLVSLALWMTLITPCYAGASRSFNGTTDNIDLGDNFNYSLPISVGAWIRRDAINVTHGIITTDKTSATHSGIWMHAHSTNFIECNFGNNGGNGSANRETKIASTTTISANIWYHAACILRGPDDISIYVNGVEENGTYSGTGNTLVNSTRHAVIGDINTDEFDGYIAYAFIENTDIGAVGVNELMRAPFRLGTIDGCWSLTDSSTTAEQDLCGSVDGTVSGATEAAEGPPVFLMSPMAWWRWFVNWLDPVAWADDVIVCDPTDPTVPNRVTRYDRFTDPAKDGALTNPNALIYSLPASTVRPWDGVAPAGSPATWKCVDGPDEDSQMDDVVAMSQAEQDALTALATAATLTANRDGASAVVDSPASDGMLQRAVVLIVLDEINALRQRTNAVKNCVATAATLTAAKTCEAGLTDLADRTITQLKTAIQNRIADGSAD